MWSHPFIRHPAGGGPPVAVMLMDTQGLFDTVTSKRLLASIFAISTLVSSVQLFNLKSRMCVTPPSPRLLSLSLGLFYVAATSIIHQPPTSL